MLCLQPIARVGVHGGDGPLKGTAALDSLVERRVTPFGRCSRRGSVGTWWHGSAANHDPLLAALSAKLEELPRTWDRCVESALLVGGVRSHARAERTRAIKLRLLSVATHATCHSDCLLWGSQPAGMQRPLRVD